METDNSFEDSRSRKVLKTAVMKKGPRANLGPSLVTGGSLEKSL
jgi:hypothetical protein